MTTKLPANINNNAPALPVSADLLLSQFGSINEAFKNMKIRNAELEDGTRFDRDIKTGKTILISNGVAVVETPESIQVIIAKPDVPRTQAIRALDTPPTFTQEQQGAFVERSQAWVSTNQNQE
ncbi:hypothetical protein [Acidovorax sp. BLS4]|uniref:hypothetical protein n=1 Tax=Acidovorax sp. BLS4 TaxID=3273430 RepID=UPI00294319F1|nr:hypothetical protein [Paracidovorax avenae]WOI47891.1 hypothetical protein R1Z03_12025 [Paracidovorax avenae]